MLKYAKKQTNLNYTLNIKDARNIIHDHHYYTLCDNMTITFIPQCCQYPVAIT